MNQLYKHTQMQETFGANMLALVDGKPRILNLREMLAEQNQELAARVVRVEAELASGLLGPLKGREIDRRLTSLATRATMYGDRRWRSYRRQQANFLAFALGHVVDYERSRARVKLVVSTAGVCTFYPTIKGA